MNVTDKAGGPAARSLRRLKRILAHAATSAGYRRSLLMRFLGGGEAFQPFNNTAYDRYPAIFRFLREELGAESALRILSFGCSTGAEVFTLRRYFSNASIRGIDINPGNIADCRKQLAKQSGRGIDFAVAASTSAEANESYDLIVCMAVLREGRLTGRRYPRCDDYIRFADFEDAVADFRRCLKPGGLLVLGNTNFRLCDVSVATEFETVFRRDPHAVAGTPYYGPDNCLLRDELYTDVVFRRTPTRC